MHDATAIPAVFQTQTMPELMQGRFFNAGEKERLIPGLAVEFRHKAMGGDDRTPAAELGKAVHILQDGDVEIQAGDGHEGACPAALYRHDGGSLEI